MSTQEALKSSPVKCLGLALPVSYFSAAVMHSATTAASTRVYFGFFFQKIKSSSWRELCSSQAWQQEQAVESVHIKMVYFLQQGFPSHRYFKLSSSQTAPAKNQVFKYGSLRGTFSFRPLPSPATLCPMSNLYRRIRIHTWKIFFSYIYLFYFVSSQAAIALSASLVDESEMKVRDFHSWHGLEKIND